MTAKREWASDERWIDASMQPCFPRAPASLVAIGWGAINNEARMGCATKENKESFFSLLFLSHRSFPAPGVRPAYAPA